MSDFKPGWYAVKRLHDGAVDNWYFETRERVTLTARVLPNGDQILLFPSHATAALSVQDLVVGLRMVAHRQAR